jgi:hypothetical protein
MNLKLSLVSASCFLVAAGAALNCGSNETIVIYNDAGA